MMPSCFDFSSILHFQVCEQCPNVKYEREGYFVTVDIEKGMQDGQVSFLSDSSIRCP